MSRVSIRPLGPVIRAVLLGIFLVGFPGEFCLQAEEQSWSTGPALSQALESWVSLTYLDDKNQFRQTCLDFAGAQKVSVLLDRRFDPRRSIALEVPLSGAFLEVLEQIAGSQRGTCREFGDCLFILPQPRATHFKTLLSLRSGELANSLETAGKRTSQQISLLKKTTERKSHSWSRLSRPRELVQQAAQNCGWTVRNPELLPHDLWYEGTVPRASLSEFLTFVLYQYDLTFHWGADQTIELVPIPERVEIERQHVLPAALLAEHRQELSERYPQARWEQRGTRWQIVGPEDLHEELTALKTRKSTTTGKPRIPWASHTFTMRVQQNPLDDVFDYLQQAGLPVEYDAERLKQAGFNPQQRISFEVTNTNVEGLFAAICDPLKLPYRITKEAVLIGPEKLPAQ